MTPHEAYAELRRNGRELSVLNSCAAVLGWDQQTYMPPKGAELRGDQMAFLATLGHAKATDPKIGEWLSVAQTQTWPVDSVEAANIREWRQGYDRATKLPARLVEELARVTTAGQQVWAEAKPKSDFASFAPHLKAIVALKREEAQAYGYTDHPYDALLEDYEPGTSAKEIRGVFDLLAKELVPMIAAVKDSTAKPDRGILERDYPVDKQRMFAEAAAAALGFDFQAGRLDTTSHPFCSGFGPGDCRITTRFNAKFFPEAFFGVLHETGHGLYEQNLNAEHFGEPCGSYCSLGIHESQSRLWENLVGRSEPFWRHFFPRLKQTFPGTLADVSASQFHAAINAVAPSYIRVEADEATYNLHILLRFEMELGLLSGDLQVEDLPGAWNDRFFQLFGLKVPDHKHGCLQDIHWSFGGLGYFPTYTLGNLYAAQFMEAARHHMPGMDEDFARGEFAPLREWLTQHVHQPGRRWRAGALCQRVTGKPLSPQPFLTALRKKLRTVYGVC